MTSQGEEWPTARELAERSNRSQPMQIAGKPAGVCPYCGCAMFINGVNRTQHEIVRYVACRNEKCGKRFMSHQPPARLVREIGDDDNSADGKPKLTLVRDTA